MAQQSSASNAQGSFILADSLTQSARQDADAALGSVLGSSLFRDFLQNMRK
jgi:hypothetical protein